jgi:uncharacterized protein (TIGR00730 family)
MKKEVKGKRKMERICVYCGSNSGARDSYLAAAKAIGKCLTRHGIGLVYGGANVGLMGVLADTVLAGGGEVFGVIPEALIAREVAHPRLTELHVVGSMTERKTLMAELSDAFIALPGGFGTLDELSEMITWSQLGLHRKPCGLLNIEGFYDALLSFLDNAVAEGFIKREHRAIVLSEDDPDRLLTRLRDYAVPAVRKWIDRDEV